MNTDCCGAKNHCLQTKATSSSWPFLSENRIRKRSNLTKSGLQQDCRRAASTPETETNKLLINKSGWKSDLIDKEPKRFHKSPNEEPMITLLAVGLVLYLKNKQEVNQIKLFT